MPSLPLSCLSRYRDIEIINVGKVDASPGSGTDSKTQAPGSKEGMECWGNGVLERWSNGLME
jgi:hypothetical protein